MLKTTPNKAVDILKLAYKSRQTVFLWGSPGVGKSDSVRAAVKDLGIEVLDVRASQMDPTDLLGIPYVDQDTKETTWATPAFLPKSGKGILFLDEMNSAPPSVQAALYQLILDRRLGDYKLPKGWVCIGAGNLDADRGVTTRMPSPLANRFSAHIQVEVSAKDWYSWAALNNIDPIIIAYLNFKPENLYTFDPKKDEKAFATPRSWTYVNTWLSLTSTTEEAVPLVTGAVGEAVSADFLAFLSMYGKIPEVARVLAGEPVVFDKTDPAICYAMAVAVGHAMDSSNVANGIKFLDEELAPEYVIMGLKYSLNKTPELALTKPVLEWVKNNPYLFE